MNKTKRRTVIKRLHNTADNNTDKGTNKVTRRSHWSGILLIVQTAV